MSNQRALAMAEDQGSGFARYAKPTRRDEFLKAMDALVPWSALCEEIAPHYPKAGNGRPPVLHELGKDEATLWHGDPRVKLEVASLVRIGDRANQGK